MLFMGLFNRSPYPMGMPVRRRSPIRTILLVLGIAFGLYFLNMAFLWVKLPVISVKFLKIFNVLTGILLIILGLTTIIRSRPY